MRKYSIDELNKICEIITNTEKSKFTQKEKIVIAKTILNDLNCYCEEKTNELIKIKEKLNDFLVSNELDNSNVSQLNIMSIPYERPFIVKKEFVNNMDASTRRSYVVSHENIEKILNSIIDSEIKQEIRKNAEIFRSNNLKEDSTTNKQKIK